MRSAIDTYVMLDMFWTVVVIAIAIGSVLAAWVRSIVKVRRDRKRYREMLSDDE